VKMPGPAGGILQPGFGLAKEMVRQADTGNRRGLGKRAKTS